MILKTTLIFAALTASTVSATRVTNLVLDIAGGMMSASCSVVVSFDDAPDVELLGCPRDSNGITVPTELGDVTVKCDVNGGGLNGMNQCGSQRVVCRAGCCATIDLQGTNAACSIPNFCTGGDCLLCAEQIGANIPADLQC